MVNLIKIGVILINQDFDIIFANDILIELFDTEDLDEAKIKFFNLEENLEIAQNDIFQIPDIDFHDLLKKTLLFPESIGSFKIDEISETKKTVKIISEESLHKYKAESFFSSTDDVDSQFKKWQKKQLSNNIESKFFEVNKKSSDPQSVHSFLEKIFDHLKQDQD